MTPRDDLEHYEATEARDLTRLLGAVRPPAREGQVPPDVDLTIRAAIWQASVRRQVTTLLALARHDLIQMLRQALTENPLLEEGARAEDEDARAGTEHAPRSTASAGDLTDAAAQYDSIWQACVPDDWDAHGLPAQPSEARGASEHPAGSPEAIVADVIVRKVGRDYQVYPNDDGMPRLRLRATARRPVHEGTLSEREATPDLDDHLRAAVWLVRSLEYRHQTLLKVATSLVACQRDGLEHGLAHLRPLALSEVAEASGLHTSTVRLVLTNTYLATAYGIIALTAFFSCGVESSTGEARSSLTLKETQQLIAAEMRSRPQPAWPPSVRLAPDEEQQMRQILEAPANLPHRQAWLQSRQIVPDLVGEMRAAYHDLQAALSHPQLRPAVLLALQAFAQAAQAGAPTPPPADAVGPVPCLQERPDVQAHRRQSQAWIGESPKMREVSRLLERAQPTTVSVLITGEPGTGKEWLARLIHAQGPRREGPFIAVRCAAIPEARLEAELFGEEPAAVTDAWQPQPGCLELAAGGTLFLDEIAAISPSLQAKVFRAMRKKRFARVGGTEAITTDARIIASTHQDLGRLMAEGAIRGDLYHRLNVFPITLPALRERREDICPLASHFLSRWGAEQGKAVRGLSEEASALLLGYGWPAVKGRQSRRRTCPRHCGNNPGRRCGAARSSSFPPAASAWPTWKNSSFSRPSSRRTRIRHKPPSCWG
jgi:predicted ATP-dependent protease